MLKNIIGWEKRILLREVDIKMKIARNDAEMKKKFEQVVKGVSISKFKTPVDFDLSRGLFGFFDGSRMMILARPSVKLGLDLLHFASPYRFHGRVVNEGCNNKYLVGVIRLIPWVREFFLSIVNLTFLFLIFSALFGIYELIALENMNALFVLPLTFVLSIINLCGVYLICKWYTFRSRRAREQIYEVLTAITGSDGSIASSSR